MVVGMAGVIMVVRTVEVIRVVEVMHRAKR